MRTLGIECATEACSIALFEGAEVIADAHRILGRGHAEHLVPMIAALPGRGKAERILVSLGPGSFTGVRIGIAVARALGIAWRAEVLGYPTLALVAAVARQGQPGPITVCMTGGHGEWFVQNFDADGVPEAAVASLSPGEAAKYRSHKVIAGSQAHAKAVTEGAAHVVLDILPDARFVGAVPSTLLQSALSPIYGRGPDARLPG